MALRRFLDEAEAKRARFQHLYAEGVIGMDDLRARLAELDTIRSDAEQRINDLVARSKRLKDLERDKEEILISYAALTHERLEGISPQQTNGLYRRLNLSVRDTPEGESKISADVDLSFSETATYS